MAKIGTITNQFMLYEGKTRYMGIASVQLPDISNKTETVTGAGLMGDITAIAAGHLEAMTVNIAWDVVTAAADKLTEPKVHTLELRVAQQNVDNKTKATGIDRIKFVIQVQNTKQGLGKIAPASKADISGDYACYYLAKYVGGTKTMEIDPMNYVYMVNGKNYISEVQKALGI